MKTLKNINPGLLLTVSLLVVLTLHEIFKEEIQSLNDGAKLFIVIAVFFYILFFIFWGMLDGPNEDWHI